MGDASFHPARARTDSTYTPYSRRNNTHRYTGSPSYRKIYTVPAVSVLAAVGPQHRHTHKHRRATKLQLQLQLHQ